MSLGFSRSPLSVEAKVAQSYPTLCDPHGLYSPWNSPGQNTGVGIFLSPGDLPNPWIKPGSPALQTDSLPTELPGTPFSVEGAPSSPRLLMCVCVFKP